MRVPNSLYKLVCWGIVAHNGCHNSASQPRTVTSLLGPGSFVLGPVPPVNTTTSTRASTSTCSPLQIAAATRNKENF